MSNLFDGMVPSSLINKPKEFNLFDGMTPSNQINNRPSRQQQPNLFDGMVPSSLMPKDSTTSALSKAYKMAGPVMWLLNMLDRPRATLAAATGAMTGQWGGR